MSAVENSVGENDFCELDKRASKLVGLVSVPYFLTFFAVFDNRIRYQAALLLDPINHYTNFFASFVGIGLTVGVSEMVAEIWTRVGRDNTAKMTRLIAPVVAAIMIAGVHYFTESGQFHNMGSEDFRGFMGTADPLDIAYGVVGIGAGFLATKPLVARIVKKFRKDSIS